MGLLKALLSGRFLESGFPSSSEKFTKIVFATHKIITYRWKYEDD